MNSPFDMNLFHAHLSGLIIAYPTLKTFIDNLYETQKFRFYDKAKNTQHYNATVLTSRPLEMDVSAKRAYGILLCSQDDEQLQRILCSEFIKIFSELGTLIKNFSMNNFHSLSMKYTNIAERECWDAAQVNSVVYFTNYLLICEYGIYTEEKEVQAFYNAVQSDMLSREKFNVESFSETIDNVDVHKLVTVPRYVRKIRSKFTSGADLDFFIDLANFASGVYAPSPHSTNLAAELTSYITEEPADAKKAMRYCGMCSDALSLEGLSFSMLINNEKLTKTEQDRVFKLAARQLSHSRMSTDLPQISLADYILEMLLCLLVKKLKQSKDFYFENNSETQFNELQRVRNEMEGLREQLLEKETFLADQSKYVIVLKNQVDQLKSELSKETKDAAKPLMEEIILLRSQVSDLQKKLDDESEKAHELKRLREFIFALQQEDEIITREVSLSALIEGKTIYIIGGHINWRTKLKHNYPTLRIVDGHSVSFDEQSLMNADMVLLNTTNMSHKLYYKVIDVLRKNKIPFDYLGKYSNQNLLEQEIAEILQAL